MVEDLEPVTPLPRLRSAFAMILSLWAVLLGVVLWSQDGPSAMGALAADRVYLAAFAGLVVASVGGTISALAAGTPGRERIEVWGMLLALFGLVVAAAACLVAMNAPDADALAAPMGADGMCFRGGALLALLPGGVILSLLVRGWALHPVRASLLALAASGSLGSVIVHMSCGIVAPAHVLVGHLGVPVVLAALGGYPLVVILQRLRG
jgi:hypothetical protein